MFKVGDKVWMVKTFAQIYWHPGMFIPPRLKHPHQKKITQIVETETGKLYQVKGGHFHESWVGLLVFKTEGEAQKVLDKINSN